MEMTIAEPIQTLEYLRDSGVFPFITKEGVLYRAESIDVAIDTMRKHQKLEQEPKTGHWITKPHIYGVVFCSECDFELRIDDTNYCPNCGRKMVEPQESEL